MISLQLIKPADIAAAMALMAIERAAQQPPLMLVKRNAAVTAAPVSGVTERSARVAAMPVPGIKRRSPKTTNTERKLADLEAAVVEGFMTAKDAFRAFGRKAPGSGGRRRAPGQEDFRAWLVRRIDELSGSAALDKLALRMAQVREDHTLSRAQRVAIAREINRKS
jgi:hypothetical protein